MTRILAVLALSLALAGVAGADTFRVVPNGEQLPSAGSPNQLGGLALPLQLLRPPAQPARPTLPQLQQLWEQAGAAYGIPWQALAAINKVESNFGQNMGPSSAGAIGWMQFMPDTWLRWGMDANGDGVADPWNPVDAVYSAARYLAAAGGRSNLAAAVYSYNHAQWYVDEVLQIAQTYSGGIQVAVDLQGLQQRVDDARAAVLSASDAIRAAQAKEQELVRERDAILAQAEAQPLLSDQLELQKRAAAIDGERAAAAAHVEQQQQTLAQAQLALASARENVRTASFDPGARTLLSGANYGDGYVFPVGGGAGVVSASHTHHDYPAVDIAAPEGEPVYALSNGVVTRSWQGDPRCGTGFDMQTGDGRTWTYCHLGYLDPAVAPGAALTAGTQVGLVGMTGDASGPHLHLQLQPPTEWPQQEAWFQSFAGSAFTWQDGGAAGDTIELAAPKAAPGPVFATVPSEPAAPVPVPAPTAGAVFAPAPAATGTGAGVVRFTR